MISSQAYPDEMLCWRFISCGTDLQFIPFSAWESLVSF